MSGSSSRETPASLFGPLAWERARDPGMARSPIGCEAPCERCWLVGGREEEAVSRVTEGKERL